MGFLRNERFYDTLWVSLAPTDHRLELLSNSTSLDVCCLITDAEEDDDRVGRRKFDLVGSKFTASGDLRVGRKRKLR